MKKFDKPKHGHKSYDSALNGVAVYQQKNHKELIFSKDGNQYFSKLGKLMIVFLKENDFDLKDNGSYSAIQYNANVVQENWAKFKEFLKNKSENN